MSGNEGKVHETVEKHDGEDTEEENEPTTEEELGEEEDHDPRSNLTKEQVQYFKYIFDEFDPQQKKQVPVTTIGFVLRFMGLSPTKAELRKHIEEIDPEHKGMIDFYSFLLPIAQRINEEQTPHEKIIEAFRVFDEEGQNFVYTETLVDVLTSLAEDLDDFEVESFLKTADPKGVGQINYVEFVEKIFGINQKPPKKAKKGKKNKNKKK